MGAGVAPGEPGGMPLDIAAQLYEIGAVIDPAATAAIYEPLHAAEPAAGIAIERDLSYGPDPRHRLDVVTAGDGNDAKPVVVFVHGGGFTRGQKSAPGMVFYDNVMRWAAENGLVGVNINYRLAPTHQWPSGIEDLGSVVAWLRDNVGAYGGDPERIVSWGHSAGAAHVGDYVADRVGRGADAGLAGAILSSGFYDLGDEVSTWQAYYGADVARYNERSSLPNLVRADIPLLINDAELDPPNFGPETMKLVEGRRRAGT
ncbi:MAG: alpha/beta hydrolase, partial [Gammaproteobacteria bacterium]|nr:alpha/beta hydrolase [Gammaproteobacteria bacterium]